MDFYFSIDWQEGGDGSPDVTVRVDFAVFEAGFRFKPCEFEFEAYKPQPRSQRRTREGIERGKVVIQEYNTLNKFTKYVEARQALKRKAAAVEKELKKQRLAERGAANAPGHAGGAADAAAGVANAADAPDGAANAGDGVPDVNMALTAPAKQRKSGVLPIYLFAFTTGS